MNLVDEILSGILLFLVLGGVCGLIEIFIRFILFIASGGQY